MSPNDEGGAYYTALMCENGHRITDALERHPEKKQNFCDECGSKTLSACTSCTKGIRGLYWIPGPFGGSEDTNIPAFCYSCGDVFPWMRQALAAAKELAGEAEGLNAEERIVWASSIDDLIADNPRTKLSALRFKKLLAKVSSSTAEAMRDIIVEIASESAKRILLGT